MRKIVFLLTLSFAPLVSASPLVECATENSKTDRLLVMINESEQQDLWDNQTSQKLSFCIGTKFKDHYEKVVTAARAAAEDWMNAGNINFQLVDDLSCDNNSREVLFKILLAPRRAKYLARAFFPSMPEERRWIKLNPQLLKRSPREIKRVMLHEIGHVLGFRHEHISKDAGEICPPESSPFEDLTEYDPLSIMHYQRCGVDHIKNFKLSELDKKGAQIAYPF